MKIQDEFTDTSINYISGANKENIADYEKSESLKMSMPNVMFPKDTDIWIYFIGDLSEMLQKTLIMNKRSKITKHNFSQF